MKVNSLLKQIQPIIIYKTYLDPNSNQFLKYDIYKTIEIEKQY
jgi:hypothetical protein